MLVAAFRNNLGKSSQGGQSLYDHLMGCTRIAHAILTDAQFAPADYPKAKRDQLLFSAFTHDLGKLDVRFQAMLTAARDGLPLPPKRVKHEASTLDFEALLRESVAEVCAHLEQTLGYRFTAPIEVEDALAFAVTHHGLFYLSFEKRKEDILPRVRREWTIFNYGEQRRITLTDLLFDYHPLGGLVIIGDLLGSFSYEQSLANTEDLLHRAGSLRGLVDLILREGVVETVENSMQAYDPHTYGLRELLTLLAGGLN
ncbi:MAG: hypothetical protein JW892_09725 [Anaerolineae bacterium]|nr:hypothetical protein [Anaerolineae bacterium]